MHRLDSGHCPGLPETGDTGKMYRAPAPDEARPHGGIPELNAPILE